MNTTWRRGAGVFACACTLLAGATIAQAQTRGERNHAAVATNDLVIEVVDAARNPVAEVLVSATAADGQTYKANVLPDGTCVISGLNGPAKLIFEHEYGVGEVTYTPVGRALGYIQVEIERGQVRLLPTLTDTVGMVPAGVSDCCMSNGTPGCDDPDCEAIVCSIDPFCCDTSWDGICADEACELCGELCPGCGGGGGPCGPGAGDCFIANGTPGCDDTECCELICGMDPFCCDVEWDGICADAALQFCTEPCDVDCPPEALDEGEACGSDTNGGCNSSPPAWTLASCGDTFCGTSWATGGMRDTDWYLVDLPDPDGDGFSELRGTVVSNFPAVCFIVNIGGGDCSVIEVVGDIGCGSQCGNTLVASECLPAPATYAVFVAPGNCGGGGIFDGYPCGTFNDYTLTIECVDCAGPCVGPDECVDAELLEIPSDTTCSTEFATFDGAPFCGTSQTGPGVWYKVIGTGTTITASTCDQADFDTKITVYCGDCPEGASDCCFANGTPGCDDPECEALICGIDPFCCDVQWDGICADEANDLCEICGSGSLVCVDGQDDNPNCGGFTSELSWCSQAGAEYLILVHGFGGAVGEFTLSLTEDGIPCTADVQCLPAGACCFPGGDCIVTTEAGCADQGGDYQGDDTDCGQALYVFEDCASAFEDISGTGIVAPIASTTDDGGDVVPIGFTFNFFGAAHGTIGIASNGYLTFGSDLSDFTNDPIPNTTDPNDHISPYWDDWSPNQAGTVYYQNLGDRFIVQWDGVEAFGGGTGELATFQAVLFEGSDCIEFRYGDPLFLSSPTVGIENADGTDGVPGGFGPIPSPGDCYVICPEFTGNPCPTEIEVPLDIKPGSCPNSFNVRSKGRLPVGLLGTDEFDVSMVDISTLQISRADGVGGSVGPNEGPPGPHTVMADVGTPFGGELCDCHEFEGDGIMDLSMKFNTVEVVAALELGDVEPNTYLELCVTGTLLDGTPFVGCDCIRVINVGHAGGSSDATQ